MSTKSKKYNIKDESGIITTLITGLQEKGVVRLVHFGMFKVVSTKGHSRYDFKKRKVVPTAPYKLITFSPAKGLRDMFNKRK